MKETLFRARHQLNECSGSLYCTVLYCIYCAVLYCTVLYSPVSGQGLVAQHGGDGQHQAHGAHCGHGHQVTVLPPPASPSLYCTVMYCTVLYRLTQPPAQPEVHEEARGDAAEDAAVLEEVGDVARVRGGDARGGADVVRQPEQEDVDHEPGPIRGGLRSGDSQSQLTWRRRDRARTPPRRGSSEPPGS